MTPPVNRSQLRLDQRSLTPAALALHTSGGKWVYHKHLQALQKKILAVILDPNAPKRIRISMPPQHGKSKYISNWLVRWMVGHSAAGSKGHMPDLNVAICSYNKDVATRFGEENRDWFLEYGQDIFGVRLSDKRFSAHNWGLRESDGRHYCVGLKGGLTSKKIDLMIIDDPLKDEEEARSPSQRERVWRWFGGVCNSRLSARGIVIVIQTRWHEDDLIGRIKANESEGGDPWYDINIPAIAVWPEEVPEDEVDQWIPDPLGRKPGEALCPALHPLPQLLEARRILGEDRFFKIYQGGPRPGVGGIFDKKFFGVWGAGQYLLHYDPQREGYYYRDGLKYDDITISVDCTWKDAVKSDFVVFGVWARKGCDHMLLYVLRRKMNLDTTCDELKRLKKLYPMASYILVEDKANGPAVVRRLKSQIPGLTLRTPRGTKPERAEAIRHLVVAGNVLLPDRSSKFASGWWAKFIDEVTAFPGGTNDDQVDMMTQYLQWVEERSGSSTSGMKTKPRANSLESQLREKVRQSDRRGHRIGAR